MRKILLAIMALAVFVTSVSGQKSDKGPRIDCPLPASQQFSREIVSPNECPTLTLYQDFSLVHRGEGNLYQYDDRAHAQGYRHIYYLFTDHDTIYIKANYSSCLDQQQTPVKESDSYTSHSRSAWKPEINGKVFAYTTIKEDDKRSSWMVDGMYKSGLLTIQDLSSKSVCLVRQHGQRSKVLLGVAQTGKGIEKDSTATVYLLVLPKPSADEITCVPKESKFSFFGNKMSGTLQVHRTGRYVFDSVYVEGKPLDAASLHYHGRPDHRDTPFYQDSFATAELTIDSLPLYYLQSAVTVSVYYRYLNPNGKIENGKTDIQVRIGMVRYLKLYILIGLVVVLLVGLIIYGITERMRRNMENMKAEHNKKEDKYMKDISGLETAIKAKDKKIADLKKQIEAKRAANEVEW